MNPLRLPVPPLRHPSTFIADSAPESSLNQALKSNENQHVNQHVTVADVQSVVSACTDIPEHIKSAMGALLASVPCPSWRDVSDEDPKRHRLRNKHAYSKR